MQRPWLAHYDYWVPERLTYPERPLWEILDTTSTEIPDRPATHFLGATLTFAELKVRSDWFAVALGRLGVVKGDRVGIMLPNCPQYVIAAFAVLRHGAVIVNINPTYTAREVAAVAHDSGLRVIVTLDTLAPLVEMVRREAVIDHVIVTGLAEYAAAAAVPPRVDGTLAFAELATGTGRPPVTRAPFAPDDLAVLQYTGGTTGTPKGAMLTHRGIFANVVQTEAFTYRALVRGTARYLLMIPYFHIYGFTVGMMKGVWVGALQVQIPKFEVDAVLAAFREHNPTYVPAVPTIYVALLSHPRALESGLDRVSLFTSGGAPCPPEVLEQFERTFGRRILEGFGLSEASPVTHSTPQLGLQKVGCVGLPMPDTDIMVVDLQDDTRELPPGEPGELCICGPQLMAGYWRQPEESAKVLRTHADGRVWLHTGDIAVIDEDGCTRIVQRKKDMIIVDGFNVYPSEVEAVLYQHPDVHLAAVIGVADAYHGEIVRASVVLKPGATATADDLIEHCRRDLAPFKVPRQIELRASMPMSAVGKILYRVLREEAAQPMGTR
jgi:long-chain acyl-CoA synthetase